MRAEAYALVEEEEPQSSRREDRRDDGRAPPKMPMIPLASERQVWYTPRMTPTCSSSGDHLKREGENGACTRVGRRHDPHHKKRDSD